MGWVMATPNPVAAVRSAKQFLTYVASEPFQYAVAEALRLPDSHFADFRADMPAKRDLLAGGLEQAGFKVFRPGRHIFRHHRHPPSRRKRRLRLLPLPARARGCRRHPQRGLLRPSRGGRPLRTVRVLQAGERAGGGGDPPEGTDGLSGRLRHSRPQAVDGPRACASTRTRSARTRRTARTSSGAITEVKNELSTIKGLPSTARCAQHSRAVRRMLLGRPSQWHGGSRHRE